MIPYWYSAIGILVALTAGWVVGRGRLRDERRLRQEAEAQARAGKFAIGRARAQQVAADALLRAFPQPMSPPDLPPRGYALDATAAAAEPAPEWAETLEAAKEFERIELESIADAYDTEPLPAEAEDEPRSEDRGLQLGSGDDNQDQDGDPPAGDAPVPVSPAAGPRYDWSLARPVNPSHGVAPGWSHWVWYRRAARWAERPRVLWGRLRRSTAGRVGDARLTHWVADLRASRSYTAAHSTRATQSWPWSTVAEAASQRWDDERAAARKRLRYVVAERTGATWSHQLGLMREALQPTKRSIPPTLPSRGCTP